MSLRRVIAALAATSLLAACEAAEIEVLPSSPPALETTSSGPVLPDQLVSVSFVTRDLGWVLGHPHLDTRAAMARTTDGGRTWTRVAAPPAKAGANGLRRVTFVSERVGWAYGTETWTTRDGGATWRRAGLPAQVVAMTEARGRFGTTYAVVGTPGKDGATGATLWSGADTLAPVPGWTETTVPYGDLEVRDGRIGFPAATAYRVSAGRGSWVETQPCGNGENDDLLDAALANATESWYLCRSGSELLLRVGRRSPLHVTDVRRFDGTDGELAAYGRDVVVVVRRGGLADVYFSRDAGATFLPGSQSERDWRETTFVDESVVAALCDGAVCVSRHGGMLWERHRV